ncbi:acyl-CoA Delta(11) desaturase-like [Drosophila pseudoobscura]|uniref:Acyl-CoA Delta(11) desaturase-like n=1 Tax=Drosophila pseudoobscura pseudoobscura TaxID=46245 RepID=A0A6I8V4C8_DROPS|nr:acyl-CoA Delta(11) desaturase [Drosophila pseudoobscura]
MPPNSDVIELGPSPDTTDVLCETDAGPKGTASDLSTLKTTDGRKLELVWINIILFIYVHTASLYGIWLMLTTTKWQTDVFAVILFSLASLGITAGAHRLWAHRTYKANVAVRLILLFFNTLAFQDAVYYWARDHRLHHKCTDTDADPYNSKRGWWFAHIGWLCCKKHPDVTAKGKLIDLSDLQRDPLVMFQKKYYLILMPILCFILPTLVPVYFWGESLSVAWHVPALTRWCLMLNVVWLLNSSGHMHGKRPYDRSISPTSLVFLIWLRYGEGYHNYHHVFPWDYKGAEMGHYSQDLPTILIRMFARLGWAYDLKSVSMDMVRKRVLRTGDGTHPVWGWGDKEHPQEDIDSTTITYKKKVK